MTLNAKKIKFPDKLNPGKKCVMCQKTKIELRSEIQQTEDWNIQQYKKNQRQLLLFNLQQNQRANSNTKLVSLVTEN